MNLQIAVWASTPLALMAGLQLLYLNAGGVVGQPGISGMFAESPNLSPFIRSLTHSLTAQVTVFWIWSLILLYMGARYTLNGRWWACLLAVVMWVGQAVMV